MNSTAHSTPIPGLAYLFDDRYLLHNTGAGHPETAQRLEAIRQALVHYGATEHWYRVEPRPASPEEIELIHSPEHIERIKQAASRAPAYLDLDTAVSSESYQTAILAAGGVMRCIDLLCSGEFRRMFAFVRPPGHHADRNSASGFCLFNNVALAAGYGMARYGLERVAIIDYDVHHGNGTQACFYANPNVLYVSSHQFPFYPGSGNFDEIGAGEGKGFTLNFPLPENTGDSSFVPIYSKAVAAVLDQFGPDLILVSAGFDGHYMDPLGGLSVTHSGYASAAASLICAAERQHHGRICFVLEGGYSMQALNVCSIATMAEMEKEHPKELGVREGPVFRDLLKKLTRVSGGLWKW
jgi:acetoin utilization deacetylase AcuC-like enzyme